MCAFADLGHSGPGALPEPRQLVLSWRRLLHPRVRRHDRKVVREPRELAQRVPGAGQHQRPLQLPVRAHRQQDRPGRPARRTSSAINTINAIEWLLITASNSLTHSLHPFHSISRTRRSRPRLRSRGAPHTTTFRTLRPPPRPPPTSIRPSTRQPSSAWRVFLMSLRMSSSAPPTLAATAPAAAFASFVPLICHHHHRCSIPIQEIDIKSQPATGDSGCC